MASSDYVLFRDDFTGRRVYHATDASNVGHSWDILSTSTTNLNTYAAVDAATDNPNGALAVDMEATSEIKIVTLSHGDQLQFDIDNITDVTFKVKMNQAAMDATSMFAFGLTGDRNDAIDTIAQAAIFRVVGADSTTAVVVESDDGTNNNDDVATGTTLINVYREFKISFAAGTSDVRFFIGGQPVATGTTFDMSNYTGALQPFMQIQKTADVNTDGFTVSQCLIRGKYSLLS